jgi:hypothetical protein
MRMRFAVNLVGTPALTMSEFMKHLRKSNLGVSLLVSAPTGQYDPGKIVNIGQNRWGFKPEVGLTRLFKNGSSMLTQASGFIRRTKILLVELGLKIRFLPFNSTSPITFAPGSGLVSTPISISAGERR